MANVSVRLDDDLNDRLVSAVGRAGCSKTEWVQEAIRWALERDEARPIPAVVRAALPRRVGSGVIMPEGVEYDRTSGW